MNQTSVHKPVLLKEIIELLALKKGDFVIDGTIGSGGHSKEFLKIIGDKGKLLGVDWDSEQIKRAEEIINQKNAILVCGNYGNLKEILKQKNLGKADAILLDLGFSSNQTDLSGKGFSFLRDEPLDMRYSDTEGNSTAMEVVNGLRQEELAEIIWKYGEERFSRGIAKAIYEQRKKSRINTTFELIEAIKLGVPSWAREKGKIHFATKTFQAIRIYVNQELLNLENFLKDIDEILKPDGRLAIISFHSLEDRIVKNFFRGLKAESRAEILTKKPIIASNEEIAENPRSRSAKLRGIKLKTTKRK